MTQSPQSGPTAPPTGYGSYSGSQPAADEPPPWSPTSSSGGGYPTGTATADSPTGSMHQVHPVEQPAAAKSSGSTSGGSSGSSAKARGARTRGPRRARLQLRHINPWTVLKFSCVLSIALFFVWLIVVGVLFGILNGAGIIGKINDTVTTIQGGGAQAPVTAGVVFGGAAIIGVVNIVLFIALSTVGSLIYNLCADLVGGVEVTLSER